MRRIRHNNKSRNTSRGVRPLALALSIPLLAGACAHQTEHTVSDRPKQSRTEEDNDIWFDKWDKQIEGFRFKVGDKFSLEDKFKGSGLPILFLFTASWCDPCQTNKKAFDVNSTMVVPGMFYLRFEGGRTVDLKVGYADYDKMSREERAGLFEEGGRNLPVVLLLKPDGTIFAMGQILGEKVVDKVVDHEEGSGYDMHMHYELNPHFLDALERLRGELRQGF